VTGVCTITQAMAEDPESLESRPSKLKRPPWLKVRLPGHGQYYEVRRRLADLAVSTVCEEARCPNAAECWGSGTATFLLLGDVCTRRCRFCAVRTGRPAPPAKDEPARVAEAVRELGLAYVVLTSVDRDDLDDLGAGHFVEAVQAVLAACPGVAVELLVPDFGADPALLGSVAASGALVVGHNLETVRALVPRVRDRRCGYDRSLAALAALRAASPELIVKSSLLLGLGEGRDEIRGALDDLRRAGVDWVTLGQYLRPTRRHLDVARYLPPEEFEELAAEARRLGFALVTSGPLVRSSYRAAEEGAIELAKARRG
jgi:lipoyl synthase